MNTDKSPTASSPDLKTAKNLANLSSEQRLLMLETLRQTEARDWIRRYRKEDQGGGQEPRHWHGGIKTIDPTLAKRRGLKAEAEDLRRRRMNEGGKN
jgi:hypothetical protein